MYVLVTYLNENDQMKRRSRAANSIKGDGIWQKFKLIQAFVGVFITCKKEEDPSNNEGTRVVTTFLPL